MYAAISIDGFIATEKGDSDWVSEVDAELFENKIKEVGCLVIGKTTFEQYRGDLYPVKGVTNIVLTHNNEVKDKDAFFINSPEKIIELAKKKGHTQMLLAGGSQLYTSFFEKRLINEIILSVHPIVLGKGIKLLQNNISMKDLTLNSVKQLDDGLVQLNYTAKLR